MKVTVIGDASSYSRALNQASGATKSFGSSLLKLGKYAALGLGAAGVGGAIVTLKRGFDEISDGQKVMAQTTAALKSTGGAANVTAKHITEFASAMQRLTPIDDEVIQAHENLLLAFTNVRNEVGKGNDVFDRAIRVIEDYSTRTGKSGTQATQLFGKALNEIGQGQIPKSIRGLGKLSDATVKQMETMVKSGHTIEAQKLLLSELEKRYGGAAQAAGKTLPGQLEIAKNQFDELAASLAARLLPTINQVLTWINTHWPQISAVFNAVADGIGAAINAIVVAVKAVIPVVQQVVAWVQQNWPQISAVFVEAFNRVAPVVIATFNTIKAVILGAITTIRFIWEHFGAQIQAVTVAVFGYIKTTIENVMNVIRGIVNVIGGLIHGDWARVWQGLQQIFGGFVGQITGAVKLFGSLLVAELQTAGKLMLLAISTPVHAIVGVIQSAVGAVTSAAKAVGAGIVGGIRAGLAGLVAAVKGGLDRIWGIISNVASLVYNAAKAIPAELVHGIVDGLKALAGQVKGAVTKYITDPIGSALHSIPGFSPPVDAGRWLGNELVRGIVESLKHGQGVVAAATTGITDSIGKSSIKGLNSVGQMIVAAAKKYGIDARAALAVAMTEGGVKFGAVGDKGTSFGPFQLHIGGANPYGDPEKAAKFANSVQGLEYALRKMAEAGAKGAVGLDAIRKIVGGPGWGFERPANAAAEVAKAWGYFKTLGPEVSTAVTGASNKVAQTMQGLVELVKQYAPQIGIEHVRGIIAGLVGKTPDIVAAAKAQMEQVVAAMALVAQTKNDLKDAFKSMAQGALAAFDEVASKWKPPSLIKLEKMQREDTINSAVKQVADAQAAVDAAVAAQASLTRNEGESDADFAARQEEARRNVQTAVEALGAAQRQYEETQLQLRAEQEQAAHDKQMASDREHLAARLAQLQEFLAKHPEEYAKVQRQILKLLKAYHVPLYTAGQRLAQAFSDGLDDGIASVIATARKLAAALEDVVKATGGGGGGGGGNVNPGTAIGGGHGAGVPSSFVAGRASAGSVNVNVYGDVLSEDQLLTKVRTGLNRYATNNAINPLTA